MKLPALLVCLKDLGTLSRTSSGPYEIKRVKKDKGWRKVVNKVKKFGKLKTRRKC